MPQTFDYMGARRAGYSVKEIQQATKDIDIQNALEQWGEKFFQKQARQREAVNSMMKQSRSRASAGLAPAETLYPAGVTRDPIGQDIQNMAAAPHMPRPTGIVRAENVAPDLVSAFEHAPDDTLGDATSGYLKEAPDVKLRGARGVVQGIKDAPKAAWLGLNQAASAGMQAVGDVMQEDIGILTKAAKATSDLLTLNMSPTEIPADTGSNVIQRVGRDAYAAHTQGMQELADKYAPDSWGGAVMNAGAQTGQQLGILGTAAAIGIRNPAAMTNFSLGALGAQSGLTEYGDARTKGFDVPRSLLKAGVGGGMEVVTEVAPMGKLVNFMSTPAKKGVAAFLKDAAEYGLQDIGGELLNTMITDVVNNKMQARPNMTPQEQADEVSRYFSSGEWKQAAATTFKQALLQSGMMMGAAKGVQHLDGKIRGEQSPLTDGVTFQPQDLPPVNPERQGRVDKLAGIMANESDRTAQMRLNIANQRRGEQPVTAMPAQAVEQVAPEAEQPVVPVAESAQPQEIPAQIVPAAEASETPVATPAPAAASASAQDAEAVAPELADLLRRKTNLEKAIFTADGTEKKTATKRMKDNYAALTATITALQPQNPEQEVATNGQQAEPETATAGPGAVATDAAGGTGGTTPAAEAGMGSAEAVPGGAVSGVDEQSGDGMPVLRPQPDVADPQATTASPDIMALVDGKSDDQIQKTIDMVRGLNPERAGQIEAYWKSKATPVPEPQTGQEPAPAAQDGRESVPPAGAMVSNQKAGVESGKRPAPPNSILTQVNDLSGNVIGYEVTPHDGTPEGMHKAAMQNARAMNNYPGASNNESIHLVTNDSGVPVNEINARFGELSPLPGDATQKGAAVDLQQGEAAEVTPIPADRKERIAKMIERHGGLNKIPPAWREQWDRINEQEAEQQGDTATPESSVQSATAEKKVAQDTTPGDLKGFDYKPGDGGDFSITKGNLTVKATHQGNGKYQASWGSATSSPRLDKQTVVDWSENIVQQSSAGDAKSAPVTSSPTPIESELSGMDESAIADLIHTVMGEEQLQTKEESKARKPATKRAASAGTKTAKARKPREATGKASPKKPASLVDDAVREAGQGFADSFKALAAAFGVDENKLSTFPPHLDPDAYAKAKPHFESAWEHYKESGKSLKEFVQYLVRALSQHISHFADYMAYFLGEMKGSENFEKDMAERGKRDIISAEGGELNDTGRDGTAEAAEQRAVQGVGDEGVTETIGNGRPDGQPDATTDAGVLETVPAKDVGAAEQAGNSQGTGARPGREVSGVDTQESGSGDVLDGRQGGSREGLAASGTGGERASGGVRRKAWGASKQGILQSNLSPPTWRPGTLEFKCSSCLQFTWRWEFVNH